MQECEFALQEDLGEDVILSNGRLPMSGKSAQPNQPPTFILLSYVPEVWIDTARFGFESVGGSPDSLKLLFTEGFLSLKIEAKSLTGKNKFSGT